MRVAIFLFLFLFFLSACNDENEQIENFNCVITEPSSYSVFAPYDSISISFSINPSGSKISKILLLIDSIATDSTNSYPYLFKLNNSNLGIGSHKIKIKVINNKNETAIDSIIIKKYPDFKSYSGNFVFKSMQYLSIACLDTILYNGYIECDKYGSVYIKYRENLSTQFYFNSIYSFPIDESFISTDIGDGYYSILRKSGGFNSKDTVNFHIYEGSARSGTGFECIGIRN